MRVGNKWLNPMQPRSANRQSPKPAPPESAGQRAFTRPPLKSAGREWRGRPTQTHRNNRARASRDAFRSEREPKTALMAAGSVCRSNSRFTRFKIIAQTGTNSSERRTPKRKRETSSCVARAQSRCIHAPWQSDSNGPKISSIPNDFDARYRALPQKVEQSIPIEGGAISEPKRKLGGFFGSFCFAYLSKLGRRHPIAFLERHVKSPQAAKPAGQCDGGDRHPSVGQQLFGEQ